MTTRALSQLQSTESSTLHYPVLLEVVMGGWIATVPGWSEAKAIGSSREEATARLQHILSQQIGLQPTKGDLTEIEIEFHEQPEHSWLRFVGMFEHDPLFDEVLQTIEQDRQADREEYFRQLDADAQLQWSRETA
jgi:predicted RNase H-like HicB family nuclease